MNCIRITFLVIALISFGLIVVCEARVIQNLAPSPFGTEAWIIRVIQSLAPSLFEISVTVAIVEWLLVFRFRAYETPKWCTIRETDPHPNPKKE